MNLCNDGHDEVCYEGRHCPACNVADDKNETIKELQTRIQELESQIDEMEDAEE